MIRRIRIAALNVERLYHWHMAEAHERNGVIRLIEARMASLRGAS